MAQYRQLYVRIVALALGVALVVALLGLLGDRLNVGPGLVPIWDQDGRGYWIAGILAAALTGVAFQWLEGSQGIRDLLAQRFENVSASDLPTGWIYSSMTVLAVILFLGVYRGVTAAAVGALLAFAGLVTGTVARHRLFDPNGTGREHARLIFTLFIHSIAFLAMSMIYIHKVRSIFSATAILLVAALLLLALTDGEDELLSRRLVYALAGGIMLGELTWALNYWNATGWTGGAVLLIFFYFAAGLILTHLRQGVKARDVAEYGTVTAVAFAIVVYSLLS